MPIIKSVVEQRKSKKSNIIDLQTAESWLLRPELVALSKEAITQDLQASHLSYPRGFSGDPDLLDAYAGFFNNYFKPHVPVLPTHLSTGPGAAACLDALLYNICEEGDGVLIPGPYWNGFDLFVRIRSGVNPIAVPLPSLDVTLATDLLPALENAYNLATCSIKALIVTNPHNPLGLCYPREVLDGCLKFCAKYGIHFISDEVYALSQFDGSEALDMQPFISILSLPLKDIGADKSKVHAVWSVSKSFGQSGLRMGCVITQHNEELVDGLALAAHMQLSALSTIVVTNLLTSPNLDSLIALNSKRLTAAYKKLTTLFKKHRIPYLPCNAGVFVFAKIAHQAKTWADEDHMVRKLMDVGVLVSAGKGFHVPESEKGWVRVSFALEESVLHEAIQRMDGVLSREELYVVETNPSRKRALVLELLERRPTKRVQVTSE